jgi:hypothetical protein
MQQDWKKMIQGINNDSAHPHRLYPTQGWP